MGKAFQAAGQAGAALHTMAVLQAYQADLLKDLSTGGSIDEEAFCGFVSLCDQADGPCHRPFNGCHGFHRETSVAQTFLLDAPISPSGLFGDAVNTVPLRREAQKENVASQAPPRRDWGAACRASQSASKRPDLRSIISSKKNP